MAKSTISERHAFQDGKIILYKLDNRPKQLWLSRIKVPNEPGYVSRGTGTADLAQARRIAEDILDDLKFKVRIGQSVTGPNMTKLVRAYEDHALSLGALTNRQRTILGFLRTYAIPYFASAKVAELSEQEITRFFDWRRANPRKRPPKETTIVHETSQLRTFLTWCYRRGLIKKLAELTNPRHDGTRRPHFDEKDWRKLVLHIDRWQREAQGKSGPVYRDRVMLANYVLILAATGVRIGEARNLKWGDVDEHTVSQSKSSHVILHVRGKTGAREVVAGPAIKDCLKRLKVMRRKELGGLPPTGGFVFCHRDGSQIHTFKKGFNALVLDAGVAKDREGEPRTLYSLRHTYATVRLQEGVNHYALARNMGTSVRMLENFYGHTSNRAMATELNKTRSSPDNEYTWSHLAEELAAAETSRDKPRR